MKRIDPKYKALVCVDFQNDFVNGALGFEGADVIEDSIMTLVNKALDEKWGAIIMTADTHDSNSYNETLEGQRLPIPHCLTHESGDTELGADTLAINDGALLYGKLGEKVVEVINGLNENKLRYAFNRFDPHDTTPVDQLVDMHNFNGVDRALMLASKDLGINLRIVTKGTFGAINLGTCFKVIPKQIVVCGLVTDICVLSNVVILRALFPNSIIQVKADACNSFSAEKHQMVMQLLSSIQVDVV